MHNKSQANKGEELIYSLQNQMATEKLAEGIRKFAEDHEKL